MDQSDGAAPAPRGVGRGWRRRAIDLWLVGHLAAVVLAPASVAPSSGLVQAGWEVVAPYLQLLYLNHGYHYFAPEPAESTLVAFTAERPDGTVVRGHFPDRATGPRLLYHRHFMLSEHLAGAPPELRAAWHRSFADHIARKYGATTVGLTQQTHFLPTMEEVRGGLRLDDPSKYAEQPLGVYRCDAF